MGSTSSKFRKALQVGDEKVAEELYHGSVEFQKAFDPNSSYGENYDHNTPLHYASRYGMHRLVRIFIQRHNANPNKRNGGNQTALHCICMAEQIRAPSSTYSYSQYYYSQPPEKKRLECARIVLGWKGIALGPGEREQIHIDAEDEDGNTALHYSAQSGYLSIVEMLLEHAASMFVENMDKDTPCDCAERHQHVDIAQLLESKMVFSPNKEEEEASEEVGAIQYEETYSGLRLQELQEAKDLVVVETADMLRVPLFTAEALLRNYEWSREALLESWIQNPTECCEKCGVKPPENLDSFAEEHKLTSLVPKQITPQEEQIVCDICTSTVSVEEISSDTPCDHQFCRECWERYLSGKIKEGNAHNIVCPAYDCDRLVPAEAIERLVSCEMARRYLQFDINAFVESNPKLKWCPVAGCGRAVQMPQVESPTTSSNRPSGASSPSSPPSISHAVDCGQGHIFCWDCSGDAHEPCSCENWKKWLDKIAEIKPEELASTDTETEVAANCLWLVTNSKPCPKCMAPIQKNDGCNHMKCTKCKHDFCWVCQEAWSKHSSETGGYFRCNRFEVVTKVEEKAENLLTDAEKKHRDMQELNRFIHFYTRFKNHGHSHSLEEPLLRKAPIKMKKLASRSGPTGSESTKFIEESILELLGARRILRFSYPYGYYLQDRGGSKQIFEFMQNELEEATETLSQMVARHYLRTPRHKIVQAAQLVLRKRHEFLSAVSKGLLPPDTPPRPPRRPSNHHQSSWDSDSDEEDEALRQAIEASLEDALAQAESTTEQQETPLSFLDLHLKPRSKRHHSGNRDPGSMTEGLLRALEMSQLLLMQQTEQLQPHDANTSTTTTSSSTSNSSTALASSSSGSSAGPSGGSSTQVTSSKKLHVGEQSKRGHSTQSGDGDILTTYDDDFRKAIHLSLQELESSGETEASPSSSQSRRMKNDPSVSSKSASSKNRRKKLISARDAKGYPRSYKTGSSSRTSTSGGDLPTGGLLDLSQELESEFERIKRETLSPEEDLQAGEEEAVKTPWERRIDEKKRTLPKTLLLQYPYKTSMSSAKRNSGSQPNRNPLFSTNVGRIPHDSQGTSKKEGSAISLDSGDAVRAVRASSDPYAPAIKSILTHLESQRALSAEHVSKEKSQLSTSKTSVSSSSSASPLVDKSLGVRGGLDAKKSYGKTTAVGASKPVWLEGPLLAKSKTKKVLDETSKLSVRSTSPKKASNTTSTGKSSLNIELYMSRKATPEEELKRERAASNSLFIKTDFGTPKVEVSPADGSDTECAVGVSVEERSDTGKVGASVMKGSLAKKSDILQSDSAVHIRYEPGQTKTKLTLTEPLSIEEPSLLEGNRKETSENKKLDLPVSSGQDSESQECDPKPIEKTDGNKTQPEDLEGVSSTRQKAPSKDVPKIATRESPWVLSLGQNLEKENKSSCESREEDKHSSVASGDKPVWERQETRNHSTPASSGTAATVTGSGDASSASTATAGAIDDKSPSLAESPVSRQVSTDKPDSASCSEVKLARTGSAGIEAGGSGDNGKSEGDGEDSETKVWQMFI
ncbi:uncharacterized protein [Asterias amurensis]|uniref:uncharacterized protein n=1 Tax=Asterias amurensis TaxID=7602 RepID=UPI003AB1C811